MEGPEFRTDLAAGRLADGPIGRACSRRFGYVRQVEPCVEQLGVARHLTCRHQENGNEMSTEVSALTPEGDLMVGYLEQRQYNADRETWWRRVRTRSVSDEERFRRALRDFRADVGRVAIERQGSAASHHPGVPQACTLIEDRDFREQVYALIEATPAQPWSRTYASAYALASK